MELRSSLMGEEEKHIPEEAGGHSLVSSVKMRVKGHLG